MSNEKRTCGDSGGRTKGGKPCGSYLGLSEETGLCLFHDPTRRDIAKATAAAGGRAMHRNLVKKKAALPDNIPSYPPSTLDRVRLWLQWCAHAVAVGDIDARTASEVTRALKELRPTLEKLELDEQVKDLRRQVAEIKGGRPVKAVK